MSEEFCKYNKSLKDFLMLPYPLGGSNTKEALHRQKIARIGEGNNETTMRTVYEEGEEEETEKGKV